MKISVLKTALLATLLLLPTASRLRANGDPPTTPAPPKQPTKEITIEAPEKEIIVEGDRVLVWGDGEDADCDMDVPEGEDDEDGPLVMRMHGQAGGGYIGVRPIEMTPELRQHFGAPKEAGVLVGSVEADSPAAKAGLQVGDIVTAVDGDPVDSIGDLISDVRRKKGGEAIKLDLLRDRSAKSLTVTVAERKHRELRLGEMGHGMSGFRSFGKGFGHDLPRLEERLKDLERRLKDLES